MFTDDRALRVLAGSIVKTGYVEIHKIKLACRECMAVGDVDRAYQRQLQLGADQLFPPPNGYWDGDTFVIRDGRHQMVASLMLGLEWLLVAWVEQAD